MEDFTVIQDNKYIKRVRIDDGIIFNIYKFKSSYSYIGSDFKIRKQKKLDKDFYELTEDYRDLPKGTVIYYKESLVVTELIENKEDYLYELKTTSSAFSGNLNRIEDLLSRVSYHISNCDEKSDYWKDI